MCFIPWKPEKVYLEKSVSENKFAWSILSRLPEVPNEIIDEPQKIIEQLLQAPDPISAGKKLLLIARQKGAFLKPCPGTRNYLCCGYQILNIANNCDLDCTYCILQGYFNNPLIVIYANITDLFAELDKILSQHPHRFFRIGTGELADSLSLEHLTHLSSFLVPYFSKWPNAILELKTKSTLIDNLLNLEHRGRTVVSWSLNAESIAQTEEPRSPSVEERLVAARKCQEAGYKLGFHFDPLIHYPGWEQGYRNVVDKIFEYVDPESIAWISLGAFRYPPQLEAIIRQRHPQSPIVYGELFPGKDGKLRYFKPIRIEMFKRVLERIREYDKSVFVYLCMESPEVWRKVFGWVPEGKNKLSRLLDDRV